MRPKAWNKHVVAARTHYGPHKGVGLTKKVPVLRASFRGALDAGG